MSTVTPVRRGGGWLLPLVLVLLVAVPIVEVWLLIQVGQQIGLLATIAILVVEAALGGWLMRREGGRAWKALNDAFRGGRMPSAELADAALVLVGGVLLMLPGFVTDIIGFFFLLPFTRPLARRLLGFVVARRVNTLGIPVMRAQADRSNLIEGETEDAPPPGRRSDADRPTVIRGEVDDGR